MQKIVYSISYIYQHRGALLLSLFLCSIVCGSFFLLVARNIGPEEHRIPGTDYLVLYEPNTDYLLETGVVPVRGVASAEGAIVPPGYSFVLVPSFVVASLLHVDKLVVVMVFNVLIASFSVVLLFLIAERIFGRGVAVVASFLWMTYPIALWFLKNPHTEIPFILMFFAAILLFLVGLTRKNIWIAGVVGLLLGFAALVRPIALLLPIIFIVLCFFKSWKMRWNKRVVFAFVLLLAYLLVISSWVVYVFADTQEFVLLGDHDTGSIVAGLMFAIRDHTLPIEVSDGVRAVMEEIKGQELHTKKAIIDYSLHKLVSDPVPFSQLLLLKAARSWYATAQGWSQEPQLLILQLFYLIPACIGVLYALRSYVKTRVSIVFLLFLIGFFWFMTFAVLSIMRYMVPIMGFVMMFAAVVWTRFIFRKPI